MQEAIQKIADAFQVEYVTVHLFRSGEDAQDKPYVRTNYPVAWVSHYLLNDYVRIDPVLQMAEQIAGPFCWTAITPRTDQLEMMKQAVRHAYMMENDMKRLTQVLALILLLIAAVWFLASGSTTSLRIVSGSENKALEPIIREWGSKNGVEVQMSYLGSVDIARTLQYGAQSEFDAIWPANSIWIELGDSQKIVTHEKSILRSPVVLGLKTSIARDLGWIGREDVAIEDIQAAAADNAFRLAMTSATQSNSGASAYIGFLYALSGNPDILTADHLADLAVQNKTRDLLGQMDRSSGSSGWLKDSVVENLQSFDAMINYEALIIEANQALEQRGQEPLYVVYPANGLSVADSPLGLIDKGDRAKEEAFLALQEHLLSDNVQDQLLALGRRAGLLGLSADRADPAVWRAEWGIDLDRAIVPVPAPSGAYQGNPRVVPVRSTTENHPGRGV